MSLRIIEEAAKVEQDPDLHLARILLLLLHAGNLKGVDGIMKLAKLDFLLRYPVCLEKALLEVGKSPTLAAVEDYERSSIESKMIRFRYGPWDGRYREWLGLLSARGLVVIGKKGRTIHVTLTKDGELAAKKLELLPEFVRTSARCEVIQKNFGNLNSTRIKEFIYATFPELVSMKWGEDINYEA